MATESTSLKSMPHSLDAERSVLGAILLDDHLFNQAAELLRSEDFYLESHQAIFRRMGDLWGDSRAIDFVTLKDRLLKVGELEGAGGPAYLSSLVDGMPRLENIEDYSRIIREKAVMRQLIRLSNRTMNLCLEDEVESKNVLEETEREILNIAQQQVHRGFRPLDRVLKETVERIEFRYQNKDQVTGVATGFTEFDRLTAGLQPAELIIIAARPGLGKTSWCLNVAQNAVLKSAKCVGIFSLEMSAVQLVMRILSSEARVDSNRLRTGYLSKEDWGKISRSIGELSEGRLFIDDSFSLSVVEMRSKARRLHAEHKLDLIIVDYLQLMMPDRRLENRNQEISMISRSLKGLAKELDIPVIAISQLSRAPEQRRGDHRPQLSDLRESGSIEQDADVVAFIHREDRFNPTEENQGVAEMIIAKQRNGPSMETFKMAFLEQFTRFENLWEE